MPAYRSAMGKMIDMNSMVTQNEKTRAVGNMNVNARGDVLDSNNNVTQDNNKRIRAGYQRTVNPQAKAAAQYHSDNQSSSLVPDEVEELSPEEQQFEQEDAQEVIVKKSKK